MHPHESLLRSEREFRQWIYCVSHRTLLLRSVKSEAWSTRIDVVFNGVSELCAPTTLRGIELFEAPRAWLDAARPRPDRALGDRVFRLSSTSEDFIVAATVAWHEDALGDFDPSHFSVPRLVWG